MRVKNFDTDEDRDPEKYLARTVYENEPYEIGLLDSKGNKIYRYPHKIGFIDLDKYQK